MCTTCGCSDGARVTLTDLSSGKIPLVIAHDHEPLHPSSNGGFVYVQGHGHPSHEHSHPHDHEPANHVGDEPALRTHAYAATIKLEQDILAKNNRLAERNRGWLAGRHILALNLMSSPGAGKTTLLERTIRDTRASLPISVIEGDQETLFDAERIRATGCKSVQINTGTGCHLEADMLAHALEQLDPPAYSVVMIENVGNLVCPALFDLGEQARVVILSVTEGADKPLKYPHMFRAAQLMILNKIDLLPYVNFDVGACIDFARRVNPEIEIIQLSATSGEGLGQWYDWLRARVGGVRSPTMVMDQAARDALAEHVDAAL